MKINWNNCFLCLKDLDLKLPSSTSIFGRARGRKKKGGELPNITILMKYLLQTKNNKYDNLLKSISEACTHGASRKDSKFPIHFCDECTSSVKRVSELHMQLETIQMTLVENLKCVRETIISNSKAHGSNEVTKACLQIFEDFLMTLEIHRGHDESSQLDRERLDLLYSFQDAIFERGRDAPPQIPLVFLEPISHFKRQTTSAANHEQECSNNVDPSLIKIEQTASHILGDDFVESYSPPPKFDDHLLDADSSVINYQVKEETSTTTRKLRSTTSRKKEAKVTKSKTPKYVDNIRKVRGSHHKGGAVGRKKITQPKKPPAKRNHSSQAGKRKRDYSYQCKSCSFFEWRSCKFEHHLRNHETTDKIHTCSKCDQKFSGKQLLDYHMNMHTGGNSTAACDFDGCTCRVHKAELPDHIRKCHGVQAFLCQYCSFSSATRDAYLFHLRFHGKHILTCDVCSAKFKKREQLFSHLFEEHGAVKKLKCDEDGCEQTFLDPVLLLCHKKTHTNVIIFQCKECNQGFSSKISLSRHKQMHAKREKSFNCDLCTELFISRFALEKHKLKDHDAPKLICTYCQEEFPDYRKLLRHITKNHEGGRYPCSYCNMTFGTKTRWHSHQYNHSGDSAIVCEECGKVFQTRYAWRSHIKIHKEKMYKCSYCPKSFNVLQYLTQHIRIHTGEKPWVCDHCGKAFNQRGSLQIHKQKVHDLFKDAN